MTRLVVSGAIANKLGNGGGTWVRLSWVLGLKKLGCDVVFVEQLAAHNDSEEAAHDNRSREPAAVRYFQDVMRTFGLEGSAALLDASGRHLWGIGDAQLRSIGQTADALINISGHLMWPPLKDVIPIKVYVDLDPGFTQFWQAEGNLGARLEGHDYYYTVGEHIGTKLCSIPTGGIAWRPVRQPVVLDQWPVAMPTEPWRFTTVASWRGSYGPVEVDGKKYGVKAHEFRKFIELPRLIDHQCEIALDIHPAETKDLRLLHENGWRVVDPVEAAGDPVRFRRYVQQSGAEFSVAQGIYVETHSGWFSDRTVRYLASGKPALVQDTGFRRNLPVGKGLLAFGSLDEAAAAARAIASQYGTHCRAARRIAEDYFDSDKVLSKLLGEIGVTL